MLIGVTGYKGSGKDTFVERLELMGYHVNRIGLADRLKDVCSEVFDISRVWFDHPNLKERSFDNPVVLTLSKIDMIFLKYDMLDEMDEYSDQNPDWIGSILMTELNTARKVAQFVGTEVLRAVDPDVHCKAIRLSTGDLNVISDIRFLNEAGYFASRFGDQFKLVAIIRDLTRKNIDSHASEQEIGMLETMAVKIDNNGSLEDFDRNINVFLQGLG